MSNKTNACESYLFVKGDDIDKDEASGLAKANGLVFIDADAVLEEYDDANDDEKKKLFQKDFKAFLRLRVAKMHLKNE